jgi:hypothetical protein
MHQPPDQRGGGGIQARLLAASVGFRRDVPRRAVAVQQLLDKRETHPEKVCESTLRAKPALACVKEFLP